jgi:hypothetical protein
MYYKISVYVFFVFLCSFSTEEYILKGVSRNIYDFCFTSESRCSLPTQLKLTSHNYNKYFLLHIKNISFRDDIFFITNYADINFCVTYNDLLFFHISCSSIVLISNKRCAHVKETGVVSSMCHMNECEYNYCPYRLEIDSNVFL